MQKKTLRFGPGFRIVAGNSQSQAAQMVLRPGQREGGPDNCHAGSDQWLFVVAGTGRAVVEGRTMRLAPGSLMLIRRGEHHEIRNSGRTLLRTVNIYVPPAYDAAGRELPRGSASS